MNIILASGDSMTMSSREIAELVESRHDSVKRTIERLANQGVVVQPPLVDEPGTDAMGRPRVTQVYRFTGERGKRDSIIVVAQLCPEFTARLVDRWQELEAKVAQPAIPQTLPEALRLAAEAIERNEQLALENKAQAEALAEAAPKVQALELISAGKDSLTLTQAAKVLGMKIAELTSLMHTKSWIYRLNGSWVGYDAHIKNGDLAYKEANYTDEKTGLACIKPYCHITPKGLVKLAKMLGVHLDDDGPKKIAA